MCCVKGVERRKRPGGCFGSLQETMGVCPPGRAAIRRKEGKFLVLWKCSLHTGEISNTGSPALLGEMKAEPVSLMTSLAMRPGTHGRLRCVCPLPGTLYKRGGGLKP